MIRDCKKLALNFNHGEALPVLLLFQINRLGKDDADKAEGVYKMKALAYSNECLISGTLVKTAKGLEAIETLSPGDRVWSRSGWKKVLRVLDNGIRDYGVGSDQGRTYP